MAGKLLTVAEKEVVDLLASAWNLYKELPSQHPSDDQEMATAIHAAQKMILIRPARQDLNNAR